MASLFPLINLILKEKRPCLKNNKHLNKRTMTYEKTINLNIVMYSLFRNTGEETGYLISYNDKNKSIGLMPQGVPINLA